MQKTNAEYASDPSVAGLTGKAKRAAMKALYEADKAAAPVAPRAKLPSVKELARQAREYDQAFHAIKVVQETEKAVAIEVCVEFCDIESLRTTLAWLPKSVLRDGAAPGWMLTQKLAQASAQARAANRGEIFVRLA